MSVLGQVIFFSAIIGIAGFIIMLVGFLMPDRVMIRVGGGVLLFGITAMSVALIVGIANGL